MGPDEKVSCRVHRRTTIAVHHCAVGQVILSGLETLPEQRSPRRRGLNIDYITPRMLGLVMMVLARVGDAVVVLNGLLVGREGEVRALRQDLLEYGRALPAPAELPDAVDAAVFRKTGERVRTGGSVGKRLGDLAVSAFSLVSPFPGSVRGGGRVREILPTFCARAGASRRRCPHGRNCRPVEAAPRSGCSAGLGRRRYHYGPERRPVRTRPMTSVVVWALGRE